MISSHIQAIIKVGKELEVEP